jgi:hypothetical protein
VPGRLAWFDGGVPKTPRDYPKPEMPEGRFVIVDERGLWDGPFRADELVPSTLPGKPWVFARVGSPTVFRILKQEGTVIWTEEGDRLRFEPID